MWYNETIKYCGTWFEQFVRVSHDAWLGTVNGGNNAWYVNSNGNVYNNNDQNNDYVVAPALF